MRTTRRSRGSDSATIGNDRALYSTCTWEGARVSKTSEVGDASLRKGGLCWDSVAEGRHDHAQSWLGDAELLISCLSEINIESGQLQIEAHGPDGWQEIRRRTGGGSTKLFN
ncbi:predicted protein [Histoplasma capsulatum var. duboisii H88]|uniref:Predicted protein n=1 Tax=Ajellomyces capsulatus (strain H88) TaxID=544711 RepID=F0UGI0_AJEC8|nr:predicted protein [Histoplasma capsulatum var. duboisii H88]